jgi:mutator protein MutT
MPRRQFFHDPTAPRADGLLLFTYAAVRNPLGEVLLVLRADDNNWELPGGRIEVGESASEAVVREVAEEAGVTIELQDILGVYSDPGHVLEYPDGHVHQQVAICFRAHAESGSDPVPDQCETIAAAWHAPLDAVSLAMHESMRRRLSDALTQTRRSYFD